MEYCTRCKDSSHPGYIIHRTRGSQEEIKYPCECLTKYRKEQKLKIRLRKANLPIGVLDLTFSDYKGESSKENLNILQNYIDLFGTDSNNPYIYIWGPPGTQKTTLASIVGKELLLKFRKDFEVFYLEDMDILVRNFGSFEVTEEVQAFRDKVLNSDVLILDEAFYKKYSTSVSDHQIKNIRLVLKHRIEVANKATIFVSNISPIDIKKNGYPEAIQDLVIRNCRNNILKFQDNFMNNQNDFDINDFQLY